ncbi:hypothetical protein B0H19DRAFT_1058886 [Mycena capillaripes]|nr:hypothetical protein B0H19DRAFT_1058886 [Mycena capillaripes]
MIDSESPVGRRRRPGTENLKGHSRNQRAVLEEQNEDRLQIQAECLGGMDFCCQRIQSARTKTTSCKLDLKRLEEIAGGYVTYQPIQFDHDRRRARFWPRANPGRTDLPSQRFLGALFLGFGFLVSAGEEPRRALRMEATQFESYPTARKGASDTLLSHRCASNHGDAAPSLFHSNAKHDLEARPWPKGLDCLTWTGRTRSHVTCRAVARIPRTRAAITLSVPNSLWARPVQQRYIKVSDVLPVATSKRASQVAPRVRSRVAIPSGNAALLNTKHGLEARP